MNLQHTWLQLLLKKKRKKETMTGVIFFISWGKKKIQSGLWRWSAIKLHNPHIHVMERRPLQMTVSGLWRAAWSSEAVRWVTATWELLLTAHLDGLCIRKRAKKIKPRRSFFSPFFSPPTRHITLEHRALHSRLDVAFFLFFFSFFSTQGILK